LLEFNQDLLNRLTDTGYLDNHKYLFKYIEYLDSKNLPALISFQHLSEVVNISKPALGSMCHSNESFYSTFYIPKRSGGLRRIDAPLPSLYAVQKFILDNILNNLEFCRLSTKAYIKGASIKEHASVHLNASCLLKLDIKNFFPSITLPAIFNLFVNAGYSKSISNILSNLLTLNGVLPQGAPSSAHLSNIIAFELDKCVKGYCDEKEFNYSRYADDLVISGVTITEEDKSNLIEIIANCGFSINERKLKLYTPEEPVRHVTGLVLNQNRLRIPKSTRRKIRQIAYYVNKYLLSDLGLGERTNLSNFYLEDPIVLERLIGYLNFWIWVEPNSICAQDLLSNVKGLSNDLNQNVQ